MSCSTTRRSAPGCCAGCCRVWRRSSNPSSDPCAVASNAPTPITTSAACSPTSRARTPRSIAYLHDRERQGLQKFIGQAPWDHKPLIAELARQVGQRLGQADGVLVFDPSAFVKQGKKSVGVQRQWCGRLGKVENCQVGVYLGYVSPPRPRPGRFPPLPAQGVGQGPQAPQRGRRAQGGPLRHPARTGPGDARRARRPAAAPLGGRRRRDGAQHLVPPAVAPAGRALPSGRAVATPWCATWCRPTRRTPGRGGASGRRSCARTCGARRWPRTTGRRSRCATGRRGRC